MEQQQPLLLAAAGGGGGEGGAGEEWRSRSSSYQYLGRSSSSALRRRPDVGSGFGSGSGDVSAEEVKYASSFSSLYPHVSDPNHYYPPSIHSPLLSPDPHPPAELPVVPQTVAASYDNYNQPGPGNKEVGREILDEFEIRQLLIDHVGHRCCWGSRPARTWKINAIEDCNVYVGTLETFIEERDILKEKEPYPGGKIDGKDEGPELGIWELDLRSEFPVLFVPEKQVRVNVPHSEVVDKCLDCEGRGETVCPTCNVGQEYGFYKENQMSKCSACYGRGLIAHRDGSDTTCGICSGKGMLPCITCGSRGLVKCNICGGHGSLLTRSIALVRWRTLAARQVSATSGAASVPDEVFHKARGEQLCNIQAYQCTPAFFADSYPLNKFSSEVIASRLPVPPSARVISERHVISVVPVTRVIMAHRKQSFSFYIIGNSREVFIRDYPSKMCWGLCCCFEWLSPN